MDYVKYFLDSTNEIVKLDTIEISHPSMSRIYRLVRNDRNGITVPINGQDTFFQWYPFNISESEISQNMDYSQEILLGDLGEIMPDEFRRIREANTTETPPTVIYRAYSSDDLTTPMIGPIQLEMRNATRNSEGTSFPAAPPRVNDSGTGEIYSFTRFPMLRGTI